MNAACCCQYLSRIDWVVLTSLCLVHSLRTTQRMKPEEKARQEIDRQLRQCGWEVQDFKAMNITAATGVAVREFKLKTGFVDYLLYVGSRVIGVIEAKPEGHTR